METPYAEIRKLQQEIDSVDLMINASKSTRVRRKLVAKREKIRNKILKLKRIEITH